jgi:predicted MFS family arabinose efflux permease
MNRSKSIGGCSSEAPELAILLCAAAVGTSFFTLAPTLIGAFMDEMHLSVREVGLISSAQLAGSALGNVLALLYGRRFSVRAALAMSLAAAGISDFLTAAANDFMEIVLCRVIAGVAAGLAFAVVNAAAARAPKSGLMFAEISIAQMTFGILGFIAMPRVIGAYGLTGAFAILGACSLGCAVASAFRAGRAPVRESPLSASVSLTPRSALLLLSLFATYLTSTAMWTYLERIGVAAGLASGVIGLGLAIGMVAGIVGALGSAVLLLRARVSDHFLVGGSAVMAVSPGLLVKASAPVAYLSALIGFNGTLALVTPIYLAGIAAENGGDGRALIGMLAMYVGLIGGPVLGAGLVAGLGFSDLIHIAAALFFTAALLAMGARSFRPGMVTR